jgi:transcriptional regulator with XRE-family HTH domain
METIIIGQRIGAILAERGMSESELSRRSHVAQGYLNALIAGKRPRPGYDVIKRIARALGVPLTAIDPDLTEADLPNARRAASTGSTSTEVAALAS